MGDLIWNLSKLYSRHIYKTYDEKLKCIYVWAGYCALYIVNTHAGNSSKSLASNAHTLMLKKLTLFFLNLLSGFETEE